MSIKVAAWKTPSIMLEINSLSNTPQDYRVRPQDNKESYENMVAEIARLRLAVEESGSEIQELRRRGADLEVQLERSSDELSNVGDDLKRIIDTVSEAVVAGRIGFSVIRGNSMTVTEDRLVCLGKETGCVFDSDSRSIEHTFLYTDTRSRASIREDGLIVEFQSRRDVLGFRLRVAKDNSDKWQEALFKLFPALGSGISNSESSLSSRNNKSSQYSREKEPIVTKDAIDGISVTGSLSSLASEVRLTRALERKRASFAHADQNHESGPIPSIYSFTGRQ
jgi:hypothetical protein